MAGSWTGVQIVTLVVDALTPLTVFGLGVFIARAGQRFQQLQWANQTVVSRRLEIFTEIAPWLNQLLCFATFVGRWKEIKPLEAIGLKRKLDEQMFANRLLFSDDLFAAYHEFMKTLFAMYGRTDEDAPLRVPISIWLGDRRKLPWWQDNMSGFFNAENPATTEEIRAAHQALEDQFRKELFVTEQGRPLLPT